MRLLSTAGLDLPDSDKYLFCHVFRVVNWFNGSSKKLFCGLIPLLAEKLGHQVHYFQEKFLKKVLFTMVVCSILVSTAKKMPVDNRKIV